MKFMCSVLFLFPTMSCIAVNGMSAHHPSIHSHINHPFARASPHPRPQPRSLHVHLPTFASPSHVYAHAGPSLPPNLPHPKTLTPFVSPIILSHTNMPAYARSTHDHLPFSLSLATRRRPHARPGRPTSTRPSIHPSRHRAPEANRVLPPSPSKPMQPRRSHRPARVSQR